MIPPINIGVVYTLNDVYLPSNLLRNQKGKKMDDVVMILFGIIILIILVRFTKK